MQTHSTFMDHFHHLVQSIYRRLENPGIAYSNYMSFHPDLGFYVNKSYSTCFSRKISSQALKKFEQIYTTKPKL